MEVINAEMAKLAKDVEVLERMASHIGTPEDGTELRSALSLRLQSAQGTQTQVQQIINGEQQRQQQQNVFGGEAEALQQASVRLSELSGSLSGVVARISPPRPAAQPAAPQITPAVNDPNKPINASGVNVGIAMAAAGGPPPRPPKPGAGKPLPPPPGANNAYQSVPTPSSPAATRDLGYSTSLGPSPQQQQQPQQQPIDQTQQQQFGYDQQQQQQPQQPPSYSTFDDQPPYHPPSDQQQQQQQQQDQSLQQVQELDPQALFGDLEIDGKKLEYRNSVYWDTKEVERRNAEMAEISKEMVLLSEMYQDTATEVAVQEQEVVVAEETAEEAQVNTQEAVKNMGNASKSAKKVVMPAGGAVGGAVTGAVAGGLAFGPVGLVAGAGIGAVGGAVVGHGAGKIIRNNADKTAHKARLNDQWQPDKVAKNCNGCQKKFSTTRRKHHCRNCGLIFCDKCTNKKLNLPGVHSDRTPRVCAPCYDQVMYGGTKASMTNISSFGNVQPTTSPLPSPDINAYRDQQGSAFGQAPSPQPGYPQPAFGQQPPQSSMYPPPAQPSYPPQQAAYPTYQQ